MSRKTFVTIMPNKTGAFMVAAKIISKHNGNIVRVSYNKAVDLNTLFIDVDADETGLFEIGAELDSIGYLSKNISEINVIMVEILIPDKPGAVIPVLKILDRYDVNISYMNSIENKTGFQNFIMGLLIENPNVIQLLLEELKEVYEVSLIGYNDTRRNLDNSIFYIRFANEINEILHLSQEQLMEFISEANRVLQMLQTTNESPAKVFASIREFVRFMETHRNGNFKANISKKTLGGLVTLYCIEPVCGSNTYVLKSGSELVLIDTGYALYKKELLKILHDLLPDFDECGKRIYITHADVDHCGLLSEFSNSALCLNEKSADSLKRQSLGILDDRESKDFCFGYSKLSRIISNYKPPALDNAVIIDHNTPKEHAPLLKIAELNIADITLDIYEGSGGHLEGEMIFLEHNGEVIFTGDNLVNINEFSDEVKHFNSIAPYLMKSVNINSKKAKEIRTGILTLIEKVQRENGKPCLICAGHGPVSVLIDNELHDVKTLSELNPMVELTPSK